MPAPRRNAGQSGASTGGTASEGGASSGGNADDGAAAVAGAAGKGGPSGRGTRTGAGGVSNASDEAAQEGGCGCRAAGGQAQGRAWSAGLLALALLARRRRAA